MNVIIEWPRARTNGCSRMDHYCAGVLSVAAYDFACTTQNSFFLTLSLISTGVKMCKGKGVSRDKVLWFHQ